jgi:hypothetical protein
MSYYEPPNNSVSTFNSANFGHHTNDATVTDFNVAEMDSYFITYPLAQSHPSPTIENLATSSI